MFSAKHIVILAVSALYIALLSAYIKRKKAPLKMVLHHLLGVGMVSETLKIFTYIVINEETYGGYLPKTDLPFHLCSVQLIFMLILVLSENEKLKRVLYAFMLPTCLAGGLAAMLLPTSSAMNLPVITVQYFLYHATLFVYALHLYRTDELTFTVRDYRNCLLMLYGFFFVAIYLNSWVNDYTHPVNFMYVVNPPVEGLPFLNKDHGWLVYMAHYALLAFAVVTACYLKPILRSIKERDERV